MHVRAKKAGDSHRNFSDAKKGSSAGSDRQLRKKLLSTGFGSQEEGENFVCQIKVMFGTFSSFIHASTEHCITSKPFSSFLERRWLESRLLLASQ